MRKFADFIQNADTGELRLLLKTVEKKLGITPSDTRWLLDSEGSTRCLDKRQLNLLGNSICKWQSEAGTATQKRSRSRIWLAYLLLRYGALRLGETLSVDDRKDFDFANLKIIVAQPFAREVSLPADIMREIKTLVEAPMFCSLRGEILRIDPGYLRRKLYELATLCDLPREYVNPRVLRQSRAMELLEGGVPLKAVQLFLGQQSRGAGDGFGELSPHIGQRIVQEYLAKEVKMKTSARNLFMGKVSRLMRDGLLAEVELVTLSGLHVVAVITQESLENLRIAEGSVVTASVKAPWVVLGEPDPKLKSSARNQFFGKVLEVKSGELASEVVVELHEGSRVCSLCTTESVKNLNLNPGSEISVMFKAFSVILNAR